MSHRENDSAVGWASAPLVPQIERKILHELFDVAARRRVCLVLGAAGWGKSTTVESWARTRSVAWVRHERHLGNPELFVRTLCDELRLHAPSSAASVLRPVRDTPGDGVASDPATLCAWLRGWLRNDLVLVVDDLHELPRGSAALRLLEALCRHAPDALHLVLISRRELPFSLARLRGQGLVSEVHAPDLGFDAGEIATLLRSCAVEDLPGLAERVRESTGGWPALSCLVMELLRSAEPEDLPGLLERFSRPGERMHDYLREEVLGEETEQVRELLRRLAVVGKVCAPAVVAPGEDDVTSLLADLSRRGLVCRTPGHVDRWSLLGPIQGYFAQQPAPAAHERTSLHRRAADECLGRGAHAEALQHLIAAGEHAAGVALLVEHGVTLVNSGQVGAVLGAAALRPEHLTDPEIQRVLGQAQQVRGQWEEAMECFQRAGGGEDRMRPELAWRVGMIAYSRGEFGEVVGLLPRILLGQADTVDDARLFALLAHARRMTGDYAGCRVETARAVEAARRSGGPCARAAAFSAQAILAAVDGDRLRADARWIRALEAAEAGGDLLQGLRVHVLRAYHLIEVGLPRECLVEAATALRLGESYGDPFLTAHALTVRAKARIRIGDVDPAICDLTRAQDLFQGLGSRFLAWPLCGLGDVYRLRGEVARARAAYEQALALSEPCHDVLGTSAALIGLARVRAADDITTAQELAARAVELGEVLHHVQAVLTAGWVGLLAGDRQGAADAAARAAAAARLRRDDPGLAEALTLVVLSATDPTLHGSALTEAIRIWEETGCLVEAAAGHIVADRIGAPVRDIESERAERMLRDLGLDLQSRSVAGPLAVVARSVPAVSIRSLGVFQVLRAGIPVPRSAWHSRKARDLLKILVARSQPVTRDHLMELLWPNANPGRAGNRLSVLLSTLRDVLQPSGGPPGTEVLATDGPVVWLDRRKVTVDVDGFLTHATAALEAHDSGQPDAVDRLAAAVAKHTGDFLEEDPYQDWATPVAEEVRAQYTALLRALVAELRAHGDAEGVVRYALKLLQVDRYDEEAHLMLLRAHRDADHHGESRRRYRIYVQRMTELGVEPVPFPGGRRPRSDAG